MHDRRKDAHAMVLGRLRKLLMLAFFAALLLPGCHLEPADYLRHKAADLFLSQAIRLENRRDYDHAQTMANLSLWLEPRNPLGLYVPGIIYLDKYENRKAIQDFCSSLACVPENKPIHDRELARFARETEWLFLFRGRCYANLGDYPRAMADFNYALKANPRFTAAYFSQGEIYYKIGQYSAALDRFSHAARLDPGNEKAYNNRGLVYYSLEQFSLAIEDFTRAIELNADDVLHANRGMSYLNLGDATHALRDFQSAVRFNPKSADAHYYLGEVYKRQNELQLACEAYERYLHLAGKDQSQSRRIANAKAFLQQSAIRDRIPEKDSLGSPLLNPSPNSVETPDENHQ